MSYNLSSLAVKAILTFLLILLVFILIPYVANAENEPKLTLSVGDSREAVKKKWGEPAQKDRVFKVGDRREVWVYTCEYLTPCPRDCDWYYELPCYYLFFVNGELMGWEDVR